MNMTVDCNTVARKAAGLMDLDRHEAKYLIHPDKVSAIRDFIASFCVPDVNAAGATPHYLITTLQLDTHDMALYRAKEEESINRFKLRVRTYGLDGSAPVFLEIKRKIKGVISKSRTRVPYECWCKDIVLNPGRIMPFDSGEQEHNYLEFVRLVGQLGARPKVILRYERESYLGINDRYARVTLDRELRYRPTREWGLLPQNGRWWSLSGGLADFYLRPVVILELKTYGDAPVWMVDMTERFDLVRIGFSKYCAAVRQELTFNGGDFFAQQ